MPTMIGAALLLVLAVVIGIYLVRRQPSEEDLLRERIMEYGDRETPVSLEELELSLPFTQRVLVPIFRKAGGLVTRFTPAALLESTRHKLELAGRPGNLGAAEFLTIRFVAAAAFGGLSFFLFLRSAPQYRFMFPPLLTVLGYFMPVIWLGSKIKARQDEIVKALPDALDLLTICVEAGLGFDAAMAKITDKWDNELAIEFGRVNQEIGLGKLRRVALRDMTNRMDVSDVSTFVAAVIQAEQLGVSMAKVLRIQSDQMRIRRRQRAEQKAHQAPIKMLFPMAFLIFPALFIVLLGPAVLLMMESGVMGAI
ncbi:MAG: type II secretion system F family protein [Chloroflexota bacterium]